MKKTLLGLAMLITLTASLSAQAQTANFAYLANMSEQVFTQVCSKQPSVRMSIYPMNKLPNAVIQEINYNLRGYSLDTGDVFMCVIAYSYERSSYMVKLRVTDTRNLKWQFYAWMAFNDF